MEKTGSMLSYLKNKKYRGKYVVLIAGKAFISRAGVGVSDILKKVRKKYPKHTPEVGYLPKTSSMVLRVWK